MEGSVDAVGRQRCAAACDGDRGWVTAGPQGRQDSTATSCQEAEPWWGWQLPKAPLCCWQSPGALKLGRSQTLPPPGFHPGAVTAPCPHDWFYPATLRHACAGCGHRKGLTRPRQRHRGEGCAALPSGCLPLDFVVLQGSSCLSVARQQDGLCSVLLGRWSRGGWRGAAWHQLDASTAQPLLPTSSPR